MSNDRDLNECRECGAMVARMGRHRRWHEALNRAVPGLAAELERVERKRREEAPPNLF